MMDANLLQIIAVGNPLTLGFSSMAWLGIRVAEGATLEDAATALADVPGIDYVVLPTGRGTSGGRSPHRWLLRATMRLYEATSCDMGSAPDAAAFLRLR
jgi:hypothetical protein